MLATTFASSGAALSYCLPAQLTDPSTASAGFDDGLAAINVGEVAFASQVAASSLSNSAPRWYNLAGGAPTPSSGSEPTSLALVGLALLGASATRRQRRI